MDLINIIFGIFAIILALVCIVTGGFMVWRSFGGHRKNLNAAMNEDLEVVRVQKIHKNEDQGGSQNPDAWKEEVAAMEQFLTTLARLSGQSGKLFSGKPHFTFEMAKPAGSEEIAFYISVPKKYRSALDKQIHSYFTGAEIEKVSDYTIFTPGSEVAVGVVKLKDSHALPLRTYAEMTGDSLNEITNALSKLETIDEGACIQFVMQSAKKGWELKGRKIAREMQQGKRLSQVHKGGALATAGHGALGFLGGIVSGAATKKDAGAPPKSEEIVQLTPEEQELIKDIETKASKPAFHVNVRMIASSSTSERSQEILAHMENSFAQFEHPGINHLSVRRFDRNAKDVIFNYIFRIFKKSQSIILGTGEIASMFHFPISTTQTPKITWLKSGSAPPPVGVPAEGLLLGYNDYRGAQTQIRLSESDRRRHLYVIGQTGTGKSVFLQELAKQDVRNQKVGMCFIDPHGDAIEDILGSIPRDRAEDVVYFDPSDPERPFGLNMMEYDKPEEKTFVINEMIGIFDKLYDLKATGGPMFEQYMRNAMLLIMEDPESGSTLMEIPKVLADEEFRAMKLSKCKNIVVREFWEKEAQKAGGEASLANMVPYITSKLTPFLTNDMMRPIISQQVSTINFREAMDSGKIILISLSKGKIGELNSHLLGMIIVGKILMAALSRTDIAEDERRDFFLYIDEFQNVTTDSIAQILSEARKYRLGLIIAHQFIGQLSEDISKAVFGNVGSMASFRVGPEDAEFLEKQFEPVFSSQDLINIDNYKCFSKLLMNNQTVAPFNISTYPPTQGNRDIVPALKELSKLKYGRDRNLVEQEVAQRSRAKPKPRAEHVWK